MLKINQANFNPSKNYFKACFYKVSLNTGGYNFTLSLIMLSPRMQMAFLTSCPPPVPYLM